MSTDTLIKLRAATMQAVLPHGGLTGESAVLIQSEPDVGEALMRLEATGFITEATKLMAHALPRREGVWWACMCARHTEPVDLPAAESCRGFGRGGMGAQADG